MSRGAPERTCPKCGGSVEPAGATAAFYPRTVRDVSDLNRGRKVIESRFRCRGCGHQFTETKEEDV